MAQGSNSKRVPALLGRLAMSGAGFIIGCCLAGGVMKAGSEWFLPLSALVSGPLGLLAYVAPIGLEGLCVLPPFAFLRAVGPLVLCPFVWAWYGWKLGSVERGRAGWWAVLASGHAISMLTMLGLGATGAELKVRDEPGPYRLAAQTVLGVFHLWAMRNARWRGSGGETTGS